MSPKDKLKKDREEYRNMDKEDKTMWWFLAALAGSLCLAYLTNEVLADELGDVLLLEPDADGVTIATVGDDTLVVHKFEDITFTDSTVLVDIEGPMGEVTAGKSEGERVTIWSWLWGDDEDD